MDVTGWVIFLAIGALAGWLAGTVMKRGSFGLLGNIIIGMIGAIIGGPLLGILGISAGGPYWLYRYSDCGCHLSPIRHQNY